MPAVRSGTSLIAGDRGGGVEGGGEWRGWKVEGVEGGGLEGVESGGDGEWRGVEGVEGWRGRRVEAVEREGVEGGGVGGMEGGEVWRVGGDG